jgi:hypothetical protein
VLLKPSSPFSVILLLFNRSHVSNESIVRNTALFYINILFDDMSEETSPAGFSCSVCLGLAIETCRGRYFSLKSNRNVNTVTCLYVTATNITRGIGLSVGFIGSQRKLQSLLQYISLSSLSAESLLGYISNIFCNYVSLENNLLWGQ